MKIKDLIPQIDGMSIEDMLKKLGEIAIELAKANENMKCCGNCYFLANRYCMCAKLNRKMKPWGYCDDWEKDNQIKSERMD